MNAENCGVIPSVYGHHIQANVFEIGSMSSTSLYMGDVWSHAKTVVWLSICDRDREEQGL